MKLKFKSQIKKTRYVFLNLFSSNALFKDLVDKAENTVMIFAICGI